MTRFTQRWLSMAAACLTAVAFITAFIWLFNIQSQVSARPELFVGGITGFKFHDLNNNGAWDGGEPGLPNWQIQVQSTGFISSTFTDASGGYSFNALPADTYVVSEVLQPGWTQTYPAPPTSTYTLIVADNQTITDINFGNWRLAGPNVLGGTKFNDLNGDGVWDSNEPGLPEWVIVLSLPTGQPIATAVTDGTGHYLFVNVPDGAYIISEMQQVGWQQTFPPSTAGGAGVHFIQVGGGQVIDNLHFGNMSTDGGGARVTGIKFHDFNGNGDQEPNEPPISGWEIMLQYQGVTTTTATTSGDGTYWFMGLPPGTYTVTEVQQNGWQQTAPINGNYVVTLTLNQTATGMDFGNRVINPGEIHGLKYYDTNGDGDRDTGEPVLPNWTIVLQGPNNSVQTAVTDANGEFWFMGLPAGAYVVSEIMPPPTWNGNNMEQWVQTAPTSGTFSVTLAGGQIITGLEFGNWQGGNKDDYCMLTWDNHFLNTTSLQTQVYIFNDSPDPNKAYSLQLVGATTFDIITPTMPIILNPNEYGIVTIEVDYPPSFTGEGQSIVFQAIVTNLLTGQSFTRSAALWSYSPSWWISPNVNSGIAGGIPVGFNLAMGFVVQNTNPTPFVDLQSGNGTSTTISYTIGAMMRGFDMSMTPPVSLNGLPPGQMIHGEITFSGEITQEIPVDVSFVQYIPGGWTDIVFEVDFDQDGDTDAVTSAAVWANPVIYLPVALRP